MTSCRILCCALLVIASVFSTGCIFYESSRFPILEPTAPAQVFETERTIRLSSSHLHSDQGSFGNASQAKKIEQAFEDSFRRVRAETRFLENAKRVFPDADLHLAIQTEIEIREGEWDLLFSFITFGLFPIRETYNISISGTLYDSSEHELEKYTSSCVLKRVWSPLLIPAIPYSILKFFLQDNILDRTFRDLFIQIDRGLLQYVSTY